MTEELRLLIVDDEALEREALTVFARQVGGFDNIATAGNGLAAVEAARGYRPDIIIMDIKMPGLDGMEAAAAIRAFDMRTRIIFLTAFGQLDYARAAFKVNADDFLLKPVTIEAFRQAIERAAAALRGSGAMDAKTLGNLANVEDRLIRAIRQGDDSAAASVVEKLFCRQTTSVKDLALTLRVALELLNRLDNRLLADFRQAATVIASSADELRKSRSAEEVCTILTTTVSDLAKQTTEAKNRPHRQAVAAVVRYIDNHLREPIDLEIAAGVAGLSRFHFSRIFRAETGATFSDYLVTRRLDKAKGLLADYSLPMKKISDLCGFSDPAYFAGVFRKHIGISPSEFRALIDKPSEAKNLLRKH